MLEYLLYVSAVSSLANAYRTVFPVKPSKPIPTISQTQPDSPKTIVLHDAVSDGSGTSAIVNLSVNNYNSNGSPTYDSAQQYLKKTFSTVSLSDIASVTCQYCSDNKYTLAALAIAGSYGYLFYKIRSIQSHVDNPHSWSAWKQDLSFDNLLRIPQDKLTIELMAAIQKNYIVPNNPTDFITPLVNFSKDIMQEQALLSQYHSYIEWSTRYSLQKAIPFSDTLLSQLMERKQRVIYLNTLFQSWLTQYKLEQITKS